MELSPRLSKLLAKLRTSGPRFSKPLLHRIELSIGRKAVLQQIPALALGQKSLAHFGERSSSEFTALAESLGNLDVRLDQVRNQSSRLDSILQDHDEDRALFSAFELYKKSVDLAHASIGIALSQEEQMEQMEGRLLQNRDQFSQNSMMFRVLVMNIRTEAARIDPENRATFLSLAAEIEAMEKKMMATVESAFTQIDAIVTEAAAGREQLQSLQTVIHNRAQQSVKSLRGELEKIKVGLKPCVEASQQISQLLAQTRSQTSDLLTSLQYQDIVRQQLDHVSQGFDDIAAHLDPKNGSQIDLGYLHHAALVQKKHLAGSRKAIQEASDKIDEGSRALLDTGALLVQRFTEMEQAADNVFRGSRVSILFKQETENLVMVASQSESTNQRISRLLTRIEESVRVFSTEITHHEFEVQLVALNGQIAAARVPDAGALNKLAEKTSVLAAESSQLTQMVRAQLMDTLGRLQNIRQESDEVTRTVGKEKADLTAGSLVVSEKLARLNDRIQRSSGEVAENFSEAYQSVHDLLAQLRFPALIASSFSGSENQCEALLAATAPFAAEALTAEGSDRLAAHHKRYTMKEEREAHASAIEKTALTNEVTGASANNDAIELFGDDPVPAVTPPSADSVLSKPIDATSVPSPTHENASTAVPTSTAENLGDNVELF